VDHLAHGVGPRAKELSPCRSKPPLRANKAVCYTGESQSTVEELGSTGQVGCPVPSARGVCHGQARSQSQESQPRRPPGVQPSPQATPSPRQDVVCCLDGRFHRRLVRSSRGSRSARRVHFRKQLVAGKDLILDPSEYDLDRVIAGVEEIRKYNPQRFEMEQLTAVVLDDPERGICVGFKDVTPNEFWVRGHM